MSLSEFQSTSMFNLQRAKPTTKSMTKSHSQTDISDTGDSKMSENTPNAKGAITPPPPPINMSTRVNNIKNNNIEQISGIHRGIDGLESPICFADILHKHSNAPINDFDFNINKTFEQFKNSIISTINTNNSLKSKQYQIEKQNIIDQKDEIIQQKNKEIEQLRQKLTDVSFECHEMSAKNETLEVSLSKYRKKFDNNKIISNAFTTWRIETSKKQFYKHFINNVLNPFHNKKQQASYFIKWKLSMFNQMKINYDIIWQKRLETVSSQIIREYELSLNTLRQELQETQNQCKILHKERNEMEQNMKRAFMRGVSALNLEAMSLFSKSISQSTNDLRPVKNYSKPQNAIDMNINRTFKTSLDDNDINCVNVDGINSINNIGNIKLNRVDDSGQHSQQQSNKYNHILYEQKDNSNASIGEDSSRIITISDASMPEIEQNPRQQIPDRFRN